MSDGTRCLHSDYYGVQLSVKDLDYVKEFARSAAVVLKRSRQNSIQWNAKMECWVVEVGSGNNEE